MIAPNDAVRTKPSTTGGRRKVAAIAVAAGVFGSVGAFTDGDTETTKMADFGSTWS